MGVIAPLLFTLVSLASTARADEAAARRLFEEAAAALQEGRFVVARDLLRRSLDEHAAAPTAFNLAVALRGTGETVEAVDLFEALLDGRYGRLDGARRTEVQSLLRETRADVATIRIEIAGPPSANARVDGEPVAPDRRGALTRRVDAGRHLVTATAEGWEPAEERIEIARGAETTVTLTLTRRASAPLADRASPATAPPRDSSTLLDSPWFWLATGAAIVAAITIGILLSTDTTSDPTRDPVFGIIETLH